MTAIYSGTLITREDRREAPCQEPVLRAPKRDSRRGAPSKGKQSLEIQPSGTGHAAGEKYFRYLPERVDTPLSEARVLGLGRSEILPGEAYPPVDHPRLYNYGWRSGRTLPEHQVILLTGADGEFESRETGPVRLLGDVLIFLFPGAWHRYRPAPGTGWTERWVSLHGDPVRSQLYLAGLTEQTPLFSPADPERLRQCFDSLIDAVEANPTASARLTTETLQLVSEAVQQATDVRIAVEEPTMDQAPDIEDEIVRQALDIIWNHEHCPPLGVNDVARKLPVTRRTLDRRFSEALGRTVLDEITACRISRAKRLLVDTDMPIKAVAYMSGFPSRERLRLAFLSHEGMPPSEYRESIREKRIDHNGA